MPGDNAICSIKKLESIIMPNIRYKSCGSECIFFLPLQTEEGNHVAIDLGSLNIKLGQTWMLEHWSPRWERRDMRTVSDANSVMPYFLSLLC